MPHLAAAHHHLTHFLLPGAYLGTFRGPELGGILNGLVAGDHFEPASDSLVTPPIYHLVTTY